MRRPAFAPVLAVVACAVALSACGDDDESLTGAGALDRDGTLWTALDQSDKDVLIARAQDRFVQAKPTLVGDIKAYRANILRPRIDAAYENRANRSRSIYETYRRVDAALEIEQNRRADAQARDRSD